MKHLLFAAFLLGLSGSSFAQVVPAISVPYIPVQKAAPLDVSGVRAQLAQESLDNAEMLHRELTKLFQERVWSIDLLPLRKKQFQNSANDFVKTMAATLNERPYLFANLDQVSLHRQKIQELFDAMLVQSYKEEYRRVKEWEMYLRDKNQLDAPYKNGKESTGLTNREAISALYGVDQALFDKVNWK